MCWADGGRKRWIPIKQMDLARVALTVLYLSCCSAPSSGGGLQDMKNLVKMKMESGEAAGPPLRRLNLVSGCYSYHVTWKNYQRSRSTALYEPESVSMCHVAPRFFEKINVKQKDCFFLFLFSPFSFFFFFIWWYIPHQVFCTMYLTSWLVLFQVYISLMRFLFKLSQLLFFGSSKWNLCHLSHKFVSN